MKDREVGWYNIKMDNKIVRVLDCMGTCEHSNETSGSTKAGNVLIS